MYCRHAIASQALANGKQIDRMVSLMFNVVVVRSKDEDGLCMQKKDNIHQPFEDHDAKDREKINIPISTCL